jgi:hypothetical protein
MQKYRKELRDPKTASLEAIFKQGTSVGELAQGLFPGGVDCTPESYYNFFSAVERTKAEIAKGTKIIYEAAFHHDGFVAALDILVQHDDGWRAYEVKKFNFCFPNLRARCHDTILHHRQFGYRFERHRDCAHQQPIRISTTTFLTNHPLFLKVTLEFRFATSLIWEML